MATCKLYVDIKIKYPRLLAIINAPVVSFGFNPIIPRWAYEISGPYATSGKPTEGL